MTRAGGAYGFHLHGLSGVDDLLVEAPPSWPGLELIRRPGGTRPDTEEVTSDHARLWLTSGGFAEVDRVSATAHMSVPDETTDGALVHPYLAPVALIMARWLGREGMHGGAIAVDGGVWAILGDKTAGKSTTLASLALAGMDVISDDVLVIDGGTVLAGPRSIDLRAEAARRLGAGEPLGQVGTRERWRLRLGPVDAELPLRGWVTLEWGDQVAIESFRGSERLAALLPHRGVRLTPTVPTALLELSGRPHLRLTRPQRWGSLLDATARLIDAIAG